MKRFSRVVTILLAFVLFGGLIGCGADAASDKGASSKPGDSTEESGSATGVGSSAEETETQTAIGGEDGFIPIDGANEQAAFAAIPTALQIAAQMKASAGLPPLPDLTGLEPKLEAYLLRGQVGTDIVLFQVGADGEVRELYGGTGKANPANLLVQDSTVVGLAPSTAPASDREKAAAAAVAELMERAFPGEVSSVVITGYRFLWETDPVTPYRLEIAPDGSVVSTS